MRNLTIRHSVRRAFTIIELLIVIAILLALGGVVVLNLLPTKGQADIDLQRVDFDNISRALDQFYLNMKRYPSTDEGLAALTTKSALENEDDAVNWRGPYLKERVSKDRWNRDIIYRFPGEVRGEEFYDLVSLGPDGQENTADDITNHDRHKGEDGEFTEPDDFTGPAGETTEG